jgi:hypothetical protein
MKSFILYLFLIFSLIGCDESETKVNSTNEATVSDKVKDNSPEYTVIAVEQPEKGWGYQILQDGKLAIDQKHIPAIQGYKTFSSKAKAEITANFIVEKMKKGMFPPTISEKELDSLGVL